MHSLIHHYITEPPSPVKPSYKQLAGFQRVELQTVESKTVVFELCALTRNGQGRNWETGSGPSADGASRFERRDGNGRTLVDFS